MNDDENEGNKREKEDRSLVPASWAPNVRRLLIVLVVAGQDVVSDLDLVWSGLMFQEKTFVRVPEKPSVFSLFCSWTLNIQNLKNKYSHISFLVN